MAIVFAVGDHPPWLGTFSWVKRSLRNQTTNKEQLYGSWMVVSIGREHTVPAASFGTATTVSWKRLDISSANEAGYLQPLLSGIGALGQWCEWLAERAWGHPNRWTRAQPDMRMWMCWKSVCAGNDFPMGLPKWLVITNTMWAPIIISSHRVPGWMCTEPCSDTRHSRIIVLPRGPA